MCGCLAPAFVTSRGLLSDRLLSLQRYNLGPNGGILTALNLFTTKFDQVLGLVEKRADTVEYASYSIVFGLSTLIRLFSQLCYP